jgi:hypothetical protein
METVCFFRNVGITCKSTRRHNTDIVQLTVICFPNEKGRSIDWIVKEREHSSFESIIISAYMKSNTITARQRPRTSLCSVGTAGGL